MSIQSRKELLETVDGIINADRNNQYGEPEDSFTQIAHLWQAYISAKYNGCRVSMDSLHIGETSLSLDKQDVGFMMCLFKICREFNGSKLDNYIDAIGYLACVAPETEDDNAVL